MVRKPNVNNVKSIRPATPDDRAALAALRHALWPEASAEEHAAELTDVFAGTASMMALAELVAVGEDGTLLGFVEVGLRSQADGCDPRHPVGYVEGWLVAEGHRRQGIGRALIRAAEDWARRQGCTEMASDALLENEPSHRAHVALGYEIVDRVVQFRKGL